MIFWTVVGSVLAGIAGIFIYVYYLKKGQFEDSEEVKYQIFRDGE